MTSRRKDPPKLKPGRGVLVSSRNGVDSDTLKEMFDELKGDMSFDRFMRLVGSSLPKGSWSDMRKGRQKPSRRMYDEILDTIGGDHLPALHIRAATQQWAEATADVYEVGRNNGDEPKAVILVWEDGIEAHPDGVDVAPDAGTGGNGSVGYTTRKKDARVHICISQRETYDAANRSRLQRGLTWAEWLERATVLMEGE